MASKKTAAKKAPARKAAARKAAPRGIRITKGSKWTLRDEGGTHRQFAATVIESFTIGGSRLAILSVPIRTPEKRKARAKKKP